MSNDEKQSEIKDLSRPSSSKVSVILKLILVNLI